MYRDRNSIDRGIRNIIDVDHGMFLNLIPKVVPLLFFPCKIRSKHALSGVSVQELKEFERLLRDMDRDVNGVYKLTRVTNNPVDGLEGGPCKHTTGSRGDSLAAAV